MEEQTVAATANEVKTYTVKAGDTIMGICKNIMVIHLNAMKLLHIII